MTTSPGSPGQREQQVELLAGQTRPGARRRLTSRLRVSIVRPPTVISGILVGLSGAAQNRADSRVQLGCGERFDHVVVGAEVEQPDDLGFVVPGRRH